MSRILLLVLLLCHLAAFAETPETAHHHLRHRHSHRILKESLAPPPPSLYFIVPKQTIRPFFQWNENNGYCGEVSMMQAGLTQGQWMSQYNARLICGTGLSQAGPDGFCEAHDGEPNYNSQFLYEDRNPGDMPFANAALCLQNSRLAFQTFDYRHQAPGMLGYQQYLSWIKGQVIAGNQVAIAVLNYGGDDPQYDHEVSVTQIGTNHDPLDATYYEDDVLYFEDHDHGGKPFNEGYTFASLAKTRAEANLVQQSYSILIPGVFPTLTFAGGDGINPNPRAIVGANYGFSVSGPADTDHVTLPVSLALVGSSSNGLANPADPVDGFNYEIPEIGGGNEDACTNAPPASWMGLSLQATVSGLTVGKSYRLYEYDFDHVSGIGIAAALAVPEANFNARASEATKITSFVATAATYVQTVQTTSNKIVVFRCVEATAP